MPNIPKILTLTNSSVDILNAIRNSSTQNYQNYVPKATDDAESIREIGSVIMDNPTLQNEFINTLVNRIGKVIITSKSYENPWKSFKKGILEFGETIEEIFVDIAKPYQFDPELAESTQYKREMPNVRSAFHIMNYQKFYKVTIEEDRLRKAFLSYGAMSDLITYIIDSLYSGSEYDEFQTMKYMLAKHIVRGQLFPVTVPTVETANMKSIVSIIKSVSNAMEFKSAKYNLAGVRTQTKKADQYVIVNSNFDATTDVEVLASAFNINKAEFMGKRILIDSFGTLDTERLAELFADDATYTEISADVLATLDSIPAVLVDKDWFMIFDNLFRFKEKDNGEGLYWNYWYHVWKTFSVSPFANNALFVPGTPKVTAVTVSPATISVAKGSKANFSAIVTTELFAQQIVDWSIDSEESHIDNSGNLHVGLDESAVEITVTATSKYDKLVVGKATVTIV